MKATRESKPGARGTPRGAEPTKPVSREKAAIREPNNPPAPPVNEGRHSAQCTICKHVLRAEIDRDFVSWGSTTSIAKEYDISREAIYRHAHATGLFPKRRQNVRAALEKIIEKSGDVEVNAAAVVSAVSAYARINANGLWIERRETVDVNQLFERMTRGEMETYAREGALPDWFTQTVGATASVSGDSANEP